MKKLLKAVYYKSKGLLNQMWERIKIYLHDFKNILKYGPSAPRFKERIWVDPRKIDYMIDREEVKRVSGLHRNKASGVVIDWNEVKKIKPITEEFRIQYCYKHWKDKKSWEELGVIEYMSKTKKYGPWPRKQIKARFDMLDQAFEETKQLRRLKTREEIDPSNFRESEGVLVHVGKEGELYFGGNGFHRLAIAKVLELEKMPACIGLVDRNSIKYLDDYRRSD